MVKEIGCTECPYAGHIELKECPDAYTEVSKHCGLYKHEPIGGTPTKIYALTCKSDYMEDDTEGEILIKGDTYIVKTQDHKVYQIFESEIDTQPVMIVAPDLLVSDIQEFFDIPAEGDL